MLALAGLIIVAVWQAWPAAAQSDALARAAALETEARALSDQGRLPETEQRMRDSLVLREGVLGPNHPDLAPTLDLLAAALFLQTRYAAAEPLLRRSLALREAALGREHRDVATSLNLLARLHAEQAQYAEAEPLYQRALAIFEQTGEAGQSGMVLLNLGHLYQALGRPADAGRALSRTLEIWERIHGPDHTDIAVVLNGIGLVAHDQGRYATAEAAWMRALTIWDKANRGDSGQTATTLGNLGSLYTTQARHTQAEATFKRALAMQERLVGPDHPDVANTLSNLALVYSNDARFGDAEPLYKRSLAIREAAFGPTHPTVAVTLNNLGQVYLSQNRMADAEALYRRSLAVNEVALGRDHPMVGKTLGNLAIVLQQQQRLEEADAAFARSLAVQEATLGPDHPDLGINLNNLALLRDAQGRTDDAEALLRRSVAIREKALGPEHPDLAQALFNLAELYRNKERRDEAEPLYRRGVAIYERALAADHPHVALFLDHLAIVHFQQRRYADGLVVSRRAVEIMNRRFAAASTGSAVIEAERRHTRDYFLRNVNLVFIAAGPDAPAETFRVAQLAGSSSAAQAVAGMAARFAAGSDALAAAVRERQDLAQRRQRLDDALVSAVGQPPARRDATAERALRDQLADAGRQLAALDARIAREFPQYAELAQPAPIELAAAQALLGPDEALVAYLAGGAQSWLWVLRRDRHAFHKIALGAAPLAEEIKALRARLDPDLNPDLRPFDSARAHALHQAILAPAAPLLEGVRHVFVVPDGALQSLPIGVLVTDAPNDPTDYRKIAWLARRYAVTVLPSVSSLRALRQFTRTARATAPFFGVGDPVLEGKPGEVRGARLARLFRGGAADVEAVRQLPALPDTANELRALATVHGVGLDALYLRERATETAVKRAMLDGYRVLAFATHGLVAGELKGQVEPALVLTPPRDAAPDDDGLLTASEIAQLKLNADWVVLSACNTAAGDGSAGAEGLSGLAKAFFYAGSRALLVSHWLVETSAAVALTTRAFEALRADPGIGRGEALRRSSMAYLDDTSLPPEFSHPLLWAPFVVVGEGGPGR